MKPQQYTFRREDCLSFGKTKILYCASTNCGDSAELRQNNRFYTDNKPVVNISTTLAFPKKIIIIKYYLLLLLYLLSWLLYYMIKIKYFVSFVNSLLFIALIPEFGKNFLNNKKILGR